VVKEVMEVAIKVDKINGVVTKAVMTWDHHQVKTKAKMTWDHHQVKTKAKMTWDHHQVKTNGVASIEDEEAA